MDGSALQTNSSQSATATRTYDAFGNLVASTGTPVGPFGFVGAQGYQEDGDSDLKLLGHRYYDPSTGRFLTRDSAKDGRKWYGYCENDPTILIDPEGNEWIYHQGNGNLIWIDPNDPQHKHQHIASGGWSGRGPSINLPGGQGVHNGGPAPQGGYTIGPARKSKKLGPVAMPLTPDKGTNMHGRSGIWIHGQGKLPLASSDGCIILPKTVRQTIDGSGDNHITVVP